MTVKHHFMFTIDQEFQRANECLDQRIHLMSLFTSISLHVEEHTRIFICTTKNLHI